GLAEAAAEVAGGSGVGDAVGPEGVEVDLVVAAGLDVLQAATAGQEVVGDVQHMIALVVRQVACQEVEGPVAVRGQADFAGQQVDGPDAAGCDAPDLLGDLVADVGGGHHRLRTFDAGLMLQAAGDPPLASGEFAAETGVHSKASRCEQARVVNYLDCSAIPGG